MSPDTALSKDFHALSARLTAMREEITRQGRAQPLADVPQETLKPVRRLLSEIRRFVAGLSRKRMLPKLPEPVQFSALALLLGEAQARFADFGARHEFDRPLPGSIDAQIEETKGHLMHIITDASANIRRTREEDKKDRAKEERAEKARQKEWKKWEKENRA